MQNLKKVWKFTDVFFTPSRSLNLLEDFYIPLLKNSQIYKRQAGYFTSTALALASRGFSEFCKNPNAKMQLIIGAELNENDTFELEKTISSQTSTSLIEKITERCNFELNRDDIPDFEKDRLRGLSWMIETGILEIKIGLMLNKNNKILTPDEAKYHHKIGYLEDPEGNAIGFVGSINETKNGWDLNGETFQANWSWEHEKTVKQLKEIFDKHWNTDGYNYEGLFYITSLPNAVKQNWIKKYNPNPPKNIIETLPDRWSHQTDAINWFLNPNLANGIGLLAMATGTGKTRTSLRLIEKLIQSKSIDHIIINTSNRLLKQWFKEIKNFFNKKENPFDRIYWHTSDDKNGSDFFEDDNPLTILFTTYSLIRDLIDYFENPIYKSFRDRTLIIIDEVHNIGTPDNMETFIREQSSKLSINIEEDLDDTTIENIKSNQLNTFNTSYNNIKFRLGLSATPFDLYNSYRNEFLLKIFCKTDHTITDNRKLIKELAEKNLVFRFTLREAINKKILSPFNYYPIDWTPTQEELAECAKNFRSFMNNPDNTEANNMNLAYIMASIPLKKAKSKLPLFEKIITKKPDLLRRSIIFVQTKEYASHISKIIHNFDMNYREFFAGDNEQILYDFANEEYDILITAKMISEGIDIQNIDTIFLLTTDQQPISTIQRIGRSLRLNPDNPKKISNIIDFIYDRPIIEEKLNNGRTNADVDRKEWLSSMAHSVIDILGD